MTEAALARQPAALAWSGPALARLIALLLPAALLGGAVGSQYLGGLVPCEMCIWQRWPHGAAILLAALAFTAPAISQRSRTLSLLAAAAIAIRCRKSAGMLLADAAAAVTSRLIVIPFNTETQAATDATTVSSASNSASFVGKCR